MWSPNIYSNMNFPAPVSVMGFLAGWGGLFLAVLAILVALFVRKPRFAAAIAKLTVVAAVIYFALLFGFSLGSQEKVLAQGQEKYFCEIDCHLAYSIVSVKQEPAGEIVRYRVVLKTRFDETTISPRRPKDVPLTPNPRVVDMLDSQGRAYPVTGSSGTVLSTPLIPGQSYTTELQFDLPKDAREPRLLVTSTGWEEHLLIGDERSPLHKKTWFRL